ncbi:WbqC family protein [Desulfoferrobacter suflitae]|uniref:WbqC family protein n=1 Tax=Desulfoferrobacter suflitae TaxID=2865782 RepID=UPI00216438D5|nr:WbqC family protein [Desulfoferrobacter suflitae]MCK8600442.1 WbqC family protein [Desulfoferrobacter suflitae]
MIIAANQPYFCPFSGFFYKLQRCDVFVILDTVQFPRGTTWITRNRFKNDQGTLWMTIPVWKKGLGMQRISDVKICYEGRWQHKHRESLRSAYAHAPYFADHVGILDEIFTCQHLTMLECNLAIIRYLVHALEIDSKIMLLSELGIHARGNRLLVEMCKVLGSSVYLTQTAAAKYIDTGEFDAAGIRLDFFKYPAPIYPQLWGDFIPNLSAFDLLFNCGPKAQDILFGSASARTD